MSRYTRYEPRDGQDIEDVAQEMLALAMAKNDLVRTNFNGVDLVAMERTPVKSLIERVLESNNDRVYHRKQ